MGEVIVLWNSLTRSFQPILSYLSGEKKLTSTKIVCIWFCFVLKQNCCFCYSRNKWSWMFLSAAWISWGKERPSVFTLKKLALILKRASVGERNADPVQWMLWEPCSACASRLQPWSCKQSQGWFFPFYTQKNYLHKDVICLFPIFSVYYSFQLTFSHPALNLRSWVTASCSLPSTSNSCPSLILDNKLGATVSNSWETSPVELNILGIPIKWKEVSGLVQ